MHNFINLRSQIEDESSNKILVVAGLATRKRKARPIKNNGIWKDNLFGTTGGGGGSGQRRDSNDSNKHSWVHYLVWAIAICMVKSDQLNRQTQRK